MDAMCPSRMPEYFLITLLTTDGHILHETTVTHQSEDTVAHFNISLPQSVDVCSLHVRISAGNSAGISSPSDIVVTGKLYNLLLFRFIINCRKSEPICSLYYSLFR